jgi:GST-like protein
MKRMQDGYVVYGGKGTGSVAVEAALTLAGAPYRVVERADWKAVAQDEAYAAINPMRQLPALALPSGELMTESAAILMQIAEAHPDAGLAPPAGAPLRPRFLRWMSFLSSQVYALYWIRDVPSRIAEGEAAQALAKQRTEARIADCWRIMGEQLAPEGRFLLGEEPSVLDIYLTVLSRWGPRRRRFYAAAPNLEPVVKALDAEPRLAALWDARMPFPEGWEG